MNPFNDTSQVNEPQESVVELFKSRSNAPQYFHALKKVLDKMPGTVSCRVKGSRIFSIRSRRDDHLHAHGLRQSHGLITIVSFVSQQRPGLDAFDQAGQLVNVREVAWRQFEPKWIAQSIAYGMYFCVQSAARDANRLRSAFF